MQKNRIESQKTSLTNQNNSNSDLRKQLAVLQNQGSNNLTKLKVTFKEYLIKLQQLKELQRQLPTAYVMDDNDSILCFNTFGNLCAITDSNQNYLSIVWGEITTNDGAKEVITSVTDGERATTLKYNKFGQLISMTNANGDKVKYSYTSSTDAGTLNTVKFNNKIVRYYYKDNSEISYIRSSDQTATKYYYNSNGYSLLSIENFVQVGKITDTTAMVTDSQMDGSFSLLDTEIVSEYDFNYAANHTAIKINKSRSIIYLIRRKERTVNTQRKTVKYRI